MVKTIKHVVLSSLLLLGTARLAAQENVQIQPVLDHPEYAAGDTIVVALVVQIPDHFHMYANPIGPGIGKPLEILLGQQSDIRWTGLKRTQPIKFVPDYGDWVWAYEKEAVFFLEGVVLPAEMKTARDTVTLDGVMCSTMCLPFTSSVPFIIPVVTQKAATVSFGQYPEIAEKYQHSESASFLPEEETSQPEYGHSSETDAGFAYSWTFDPQENKRSFNIGLALIFAFIAGIILNVMPCVLPVLGIKILSFSEGREGSKKTSILKSLVFAAGMLTVFMALASLAAFAGFSWGEQFQTPGMLVGIIAVIFVFGLGMFDVFLILVPPKLAAMNQSGRKGFADDFLKGMFATILATPCSGPLLGATLAWTLTQPAYVIYLIFGALGLGMASPYVLLASSKKLSKMIPKPGSWMSDFKHTMGFLLFGFAVYLMVGLPKDMVVSAVGLCVTLAFAVAVYGRFAPFGSSIKRKLFSLSFALLIAWGGYYLSFPLLYGSISDAAVQKSEASADLWQEFSPETLEAALSESHSVVVNFTANWCMNCQFNKVTVLHTEEMNQLLKEKGVLALKADLTSANPAAEELLHTLGSRSVPFLAIFKGDDPAHPIIMRDILNKKRVLKSIKDLP